LMKFLLSLFFLLSFQWGFRLSTSMVVEPLIPLTSKCFPINPVSYQSFSFWVELQRCNSKYP
jgi:hypothetical protein